MSAFSILTRQNNVRIFDIQLTIKWANTTKKQLTESNTNGKSNDETRPDGPEGSDVRLVDVIDDDGGDGHDLAWPRGHQGHDQHGEDHVAARHTQLLLGHEGRHQTCGHKNAVIIL